MSDTKLTRSPHLYSYVKVIPSYECARGCDYCYNRLLAQRSSPDSDAVLATLDQVLGDAQGPMSVEVIGGEPLQRPALDDTQRVLSICRADPRVTRTILSTAIASVDVLRTVTPWLDLLYLSVDAGAHSATNKKFVGARKLQEIVALASETGCQLSVSAVLSGEEQMAEIRDFIDLVMSAGIDSIGIVHTTGVYLSDKQIDSICATYHQLFRLSLFLRPKVRIVNSFLESIEVSLMGGRRAAACECARNSVAIEPDGRIIPGLCIDHELPFISPDRFAESQAVRRQFLQSVDCGQCPLWSVCYGGCATEARRFNGQFAAKAPFQCAIMLGVWRLVQNDLGSDLS